MKVKVFGAIALAVVMGLASCGKPEDEPKKVTGISIKQGTELTMAEGEQMRLTAALEPEGVDGVVAWSTSDSTIVSVAVNGVIKANLAGEAVVTASCEEFKAEIKITVKPYFEMLKFTNAIMHDVAAEPIDTTIYELEVTYSTGEEATINAQKYAATLWVCADGFFVNESGEWDGSTDGTVLTIPTHLYIATPEINPETGASGRVSLGSYLVTNDTEEYSDTTVHIGRPGVITDENTYISYFDEFCNRFNDYISTGNSDSRSSAYDMLDSAYTLVANSHMLTLTYYSVSDGAPQDGYYLPRICDGIVDYAYFSLNANGISRYMTGMDFFQAKVKVFDEYYGAKIEEDGEFIKLGDRNIHFIEYNYVTGTIPQQQSVKQKTQRLHAIPVTVLSEMPMVKYSLDQQLQSRVKRALR